MFDVIDDIVSTGFDWAGDAFDWAADGIGDVFSGNFSSTDLGELFGKFEFNDVLKALGGNGGAAGALKTVLGLLRGGAGAYSDIARSDAIIKRYMNELAIYKEQLDLLGIETPIAIDKVLNELGWAKTRVDIQTAMNDSEAQFTSQINLLRGEQIDAKIAEARARLELFGPQFAAIDVRQQNVRDTLDVRSKVLRGDMETLVKTADLDIASYGNQKAMIQKMAEFEAGTRRVQMLREEGRAWVTAAHYGVMTGLPSSAGNEAGFQTMMGRREIAHILGMASLRTAGIDLAIEKTEVARDSAIRRAEAELELLNKTSANQLALLDIERTSLGIQQRIAAMGISSAEIDKQILAASSAYAMAKASFQNNLLRSQLGFATAGAELDIDLIEARSASRGRMLDLQIKGAQDMIELAESQGDFALLGRGLDLLLGPGYEIASNIFGGSGKSNPLDGLDLGSADPTTEVVGSYATDYGFDYSALGTE